MPVIFLVLALLGFSLSAQTTFESPLKAKLAAALETPMSTGMNVEAALTAWFAAEKATDLAAKEAHYKAGLAALENLQPLPQAKWPDNPTDTPFKVLETIVYESFTKAGLTIEVVEFEVDELTQYGVQVRPSTGGPYPMAVYLHGAAFGVPSYQLSPMGRMALDGYVVVAPALRGEDLFVSQSVPTKKPYKCEGHIENLLGEPRDVLAIADGASKQSFVKVGKFALVGHSFGSGAGLLAAERTDKVACVVSYDAWFVNPFYFYWLRLSGGSKYYWESWEYFLEKPIAEQLSGLMARSSAHHTDRLTAPVLLFVGEFDGPGYHTSHEYMASELKENNKPHQHIVIPGGGHNFVLYNDEPARKAEVIQRAFLHKHLPPVAVPRGTAKP
ncbi:MAG: dienelactone hydrolase [Rhodothermales bacterium]|jgi:dienelactone hydrolase